VTHASEEVADVTLERLDALDAVVHEAESGRLEPAEIRLVEVIQEWIAVLDKDRWTNLDIAGAFFLIAARLILLKVRLLLPSPPVEEDATVLPDLEEMRLVYGMGERLGVLEEWEDRFELCGIAADLSKRDTTWKDAELLPSLLMAAGALFLRAEMQRPHMLTGESISPEEAIRRVVGFLTHKQRVVEDLLEQAATLLEMLSYFLAVLELIRRGTCGLRERRGSLWVRLLEPEIAQEKENPGD
jgi:segregation and condensation protein A